MATITTVSGDTWDVLSKKAYGTEMFMDVLMRANITHRKAAIFPAGVVLSVPAIDDATIENTTNLPPWKATGGQ